MAQMAKKDSELLVIKIKSRGKRREKCGVAGGKRVYAVPVRKERCDCLNERVGPSCGIEVFDNVGNSPGQSACSEHDQNLFQSALLVFVFI